MGKGRFGKGLSAIVVTAALVGPVLVAAAPSASAAPTTQASGLAVVNIAAALTEPTAVRFAPDGRFFVAEKRGTIKAYSAIGATASTVIDLQTEVNSFWDRGLLGLEVDSQFPTRPYLYALYARDAIPGGAGPPRWNDACPNPPGSTTDGCVVGARLVRITVNTTTNVAVPFSVVTLIDTTANSGWCFQFPSHAIGSVKMGADGQLYVGAGDGASFNGVDYGQLGGTLPAGGPFVTPADPCGPNPGTAEQQATAVGGALRSQAPRIGGTSWYDGSIVRVGPDPGAPAPAVVAYGLRNPFRFNFRPGTSELWLGDVGYNKWEEIDRFTPGVGPVPNFGWPCYEGFGALSDYQNLGTDACTSLPLSAVTLPYYTYQHGANPDLSHCSPPSVGGNAIMGGTFYGGGEWPSPYGGAYLFGDNSRRCIWAMLAPSPGALPN